MTRDQARADGLEPLRQRWRALRPRERIGVALALGVVALWLLLALAVRPAWRVLQQAPQARAVLDEQWQRMQAEAAQAAALRAQPPVSSEDAMVALEVANEALGEGVQMRQQGDQIQLTLGAVEAEALQSWLAEARGAARARVVEARLTVAPDGRLAGSLVLTLGGGT